MNIRKRLAESNWGRRIALLTTGTIMATLLGFAVAAPSAYACTAGIGGNVNLYASSQQTLTITTDWVDKAPQYVMQPGTSDNYRIPGTGCVEDTDGVYARSGSVIHRTSNGGLTWSTFDVGPSWTKISDGTTINVRQMYCSRTTLGC